MFKSKEQFKKMYLEKFEQIHGKKIEEGTSLDLYIALASLIRDQITSCWVQTNNLYCKQDERQVYYFSIEFLPGKFLGRNLIYMGIRQIVEESLCEMGIELSQLELEEPDAGLGNGGLGRLGACLLDSMVSLGIAGHACSIRYKYGLFKQKIVDGFQVELPDNWLNNGNVWEIRKPDKAVEVKFGGNVRIDNSCGRMIFIHENYEGVMAVPYDIPVIGYKNNIVNNLRLWSAETFNKDFDLSIFNRGDYLKAVEYKYSVQSISQILYPDDSNDQGKLLRLKQQYFLVSAGLQSIVKRYRKKHGSLENFSGKIAIHINDTHPALCIAELMRILIDEEGMGWDEAWQITINTMSYTNHTILPEALEKWPVDLLKSLLPRIYMIIQEINKRFCKDLQDKYPGDWLRMNEMAIIADGYVKMAHLAIVGSYSVNGVASIHTKILKNHVMRNFYELYPHKFNNKTNGISHRRFLLKSNPFLAKLLTETIGSQWIKEPKDLVNLLNYTDDLSFQDKINQVKRDNKLRLSKLIKDKYDMTVDVDSIFDVHVKRIHAYKRQLLNVFHILDLYNRLSESPSLDITPRTFIFAGKAAPGYYLAKKIIKLINTLASKVNRDKRIKDKIKVIFLENYNVSLAELIIPATDVSEQISTASKEASGTGNMKFIMNGAITLGTLDGANIEIRDEVGEENMITFGLTVDQVLNFYNQGGYSSWEEYHKDPRLQKILSQLIDGFFPETQEEFRDIYHSLLHDNDEFFLLKDFSSYVEAQAKVEERFRDRNKWLKMCICNIARSGKFYSDRTISEYAEDIWRIKPVLKWSERVRLG